jgi:RHS repeat-associated protein
MTAATLPAFTGIVSSYSYDNAGGLTGISHVQNGSTTIASVAYTLDAVGNRTQRVDQQGTHSYSYDNLYRLTSVTYPGPSTTSYAFDAFGNRTSLTDGSGTTGYSYDDADRLTTVTPPSPAPSVSYTWDNNGDLTARGSDSFAWDYEDRMTSATVGGTTTTFAYRGDGLRNSRTTGGSTTAFTWDVNAGLPVVLDDGNQYVYGAGLASMVTGGSTYYYLADGLGSTMAIVDTSGAVQKSYTYDVYGKPTATGSLANEYDFAGQETDGTGLQYLRARYMDPDTGRFLSRDPLAAAPAWGEHPFGYAGGSPASSADPTGLWCLLGACADRNGVSIGGHEIVEGIKSVADWVRDTAWSQVREAVNGPLSDIARALAKKYGGICKDIGDGITACTGLGSLLDALGISGRAFTLGNVILTREKSLDNLDEDFIDHEIRHADQWALFGLAGLATSGSPLLGQVGMFVTYMLNVSTAKLDGGGKCENVFEIWAGLEGGGYEC